MKMNDGKIYIPALRRKQKKNQQAVIRVTAEAYNVLVEIYEESPLSMKQIASEIITQAKNLIVYQKED